MCAVWGEGGVKEVNQGCLLDALHWGNRRDGISTGKYVLAMLEKVITCISSDLWHMELYFQSCGGHLH